MHVVLGPMAATSALAWARNAKRVVALVRAADAGSPTDVPDHIADAFDAYLDEWLAVAERGGDFRWESDVDPADIRPLAAYWFHLAALIADRAEELGLPVAPPEAEPFYVALVSTMTDALVRADDPEHFGDKLKELWPLDAPRPHLAPPAAGPVRVLLVDDTPDVRLLLRFALEHDDRFEVVGEAEHGQAAVDFFASHPCPDVVVLDLMMPVMDGITALPLLKRCCPNSRVFVFSAAAAEVDHAEMLGMGAERVLDKTVSLADLTALLAA